MGINVFYNFYVPGNSVRAAEVLSCFAVLLSDPAVDRVVVLADEFQGADGTRVLVRKLAGRPTFADYFQAMREVSGPDDVNVVINSDCVIHPSTTPALNSIQADEAWCISRHDVKSLVPVVDARTLMHWERTNSQDCWVVRGQPREGMWLDFSPGLPGCDNRLAHELQAAGYRILDPFLTIRVLHYHPSNERSWTAKDQIPPPYASPKKFGFRESLLDRYMGLREGLAKLKSRMSGRS